MLKILIEVECRICGEKFNATLEQLDHYFYCPSCQNTGNVNQTFKIMSAEA